MPISLTTVRATEGDFKPKRNSRAGKMDRIPEDTPGSRQSEAAACFSPPSKMI